MVTEIEYALMAGASYISTRSAVNKFPVPDGWIESIDDREAAPSGFEATYFTRDSEIVISFAGTYPSDIAGDMLANAGLALGTGSIQLLQAAQYYLQVKAANSDPNVTISLTGHSLGGGLASLLAVFFGERAVTFDQAPFKNSALTFTDTDPDTGVVTTRSVAQNLRADLVAGGMTSEKLAKLDAYILASNPTNPAPNAADTFAVRSGQVTNTKVQGEFVSSWYPIPSSFDRIGLETEILNSSGGVGGIDMHAQALLTAYLQSRQTAVTSGGQVQSLSEVTFKLTDLLQMIFDKTLFARETDTGNTTDPNFLEFIVNHETGRDPRTNAEITPDTMVTRFTKDLWKLAQDSGLTMVDEPEFRTNFLSRALTAFAMQKYYTETVASVGYGKTLFSDIGVTNGIQFDIQDVAASVADAKGFDDFKVFLDKYYLKLTPDGSLSFDPARDLILSALPSLRDWYIQAGTGGMSATDTHNRNAFMFGNTDNDFLTGGTGNDLLVGNVGDDFLTGRNGDDILIGGAGRDIYEYDPARDGTPDGHDTILDVDGKGILRYQYKDQDNKLQSTVLAGVAIKEPDGTWKTPDGRFILEQVNAGADLKVSFDAVADGSVTIRDFDFAKAAQGGYFGIRLVEAQALPVTTRDIFGDYAYLPNPNGPPFLDDLGNLLPNLTSPVTTGPDLLQDGDGNDHIEGRLYSDWLLARRGGDNILRGGAGRDYLEGGSENDVLEGGGDGDIGLLGGVFSGAPSFAFDIIGGDAILGGAGDDRIYGNVARPIADLIRDGESGPTGTLRGDVLDGGDGNDLLAGDVNGDVLLGGSGDDLLIGGAADDFLFGDHEKAFLPVDIQDPQAFPYCGWSITSVETETTRADTFPQFSNLFAEAATPGRDVIYGGAGNDKVFAGGNDDVVWGGSGEDWLFGQGGSDVLIGGSGKDVLSGDGAGTPLGLQGDDYLDGGDNDDFLFGDGGNDILIGGAGKDTYVYNRGDGEDIIIDTAAGANDPEASILVLGDGIMAGDLKFRPGSLMIDLGPSSQDDPFAGNDQIYFVNFNKEFPDFSAAIGEIRFADGSSMDYADILAQGFDIDGTAFDDAGGTALIGTAVTDRIRGHASSDVLEGRAGDDVLIGDAGADHLDGGDGNDVLDGGTGNDLLAGGFGSDDYIFNAGDGQDTIIEGLLFLPGTADPGSVDRIVFGAGIARGDVTLLRSADGNLAIRYGVGDEILVEDQYSLPGSEIENIVFADGQIINKTELDALEIGVVDGTAGGDELYGTAGNDVLQGHDGDDYLDGRPSPDRRIAGTRLVTGDDVLDGGTGSDTYALYWGMGNDRIIDAVDGLSNTLTLLEGATLDSVKTTRDGADLLVTMRGAGGSARVQGFFVDGSASSWQIASELDGSQSLLDVYEAQSAEDNAFALNAMEDYKQQLIGEWRARGQSNFELPTLAYVRSTYSQTIWEYTKITYTQFGPVTEIITGANAPDLSTSIGGFGIRRGGKVIQQPIINNVGVQRYASAYAEETISDAAVITVSLNGGEIYSDSVTYSFFAGGGGPFGNERTYSYSNGFMRNTVTQSSTEGWVTLHLREDDLGNFHLTVQQIAEELDLAQIKAGSGDNTIFGVLGSDLYNVALIDAGAGDDVIYAGDRDFVFGNDGDDEIDGGAYAYGGNGFDWLTNGQFMAGGADDDYLGGGEGATTFYFRSDEAGWDFVEDQNGISLTEFAVRAGFSDSPSNLVYGGKYRLSGETSLEFQLAFEASLGERRAYGDFMQATSVFAEIELSDGSFLQYPTIGEGAGFPRGVPDPFFRGPYRGDGYDTWVYNSIADMLRDLAALGLSYNPADIHLIPGVPDLSDFTANNYEALQPFFDSGVLESDVLVLDRVAGNTDELIVGFAPPEYDYDGRRTLRLVWGEDKIIETELPSAVDLIGYGIEEVRLGNTHFYIGHLVEMANETGYLGTPFDDYLEGTAGDDRIRGLGGWDFIEGGAGNDLLSGGAGIDEFFFEAGAGSDTIVDPDAEDLIVFGNGVTPEQIRLGLGSLRLSYGDAGDEIHFEGFDPDDVYGIPMFAALQFYDTDTWELLDELSYEQVLARGFDVTGTANDDVLTGTNIHDRFEGGAGNDQLAGGAGSDTYYFNAGDGVDIVVDAVESGAINRVVLRDYLESDITGSRESGHVVLQTTGTQDVVRILWDEGSGIGVDLVEFSNGATWDHAYLNQLPGTTGNSPPVVAAAIGAVLATEDASFNFALPANTFQDPDAGDVLIYSATLADGSELPLWLEFDAETHTFSGNPENDDVGTVLVRVTATDAAGLSAADTFDLTVLNVNDAPVLINALADQSATEDQTFSFVIPGSAFTDVDAGDTLTYTATLSNGAALPEWLSFDDVNYVFSGTPGNADVGSLNVRVTATDDDGESASDVFTIAISNVNDAPELSNPLMDQAVTAGELFTYVVPVATFIDVDVGDSVTLAAQLAGGAALPAWLAFDAAAGTFSGSFSGIPSTSNVGVLEVEVIATDDLGATGNDQFVLTVNPAAGLTLIGTTGADSLFGGYGNDLIDGLGGADYMAGGDGDDSYTVDHTGDVVVENPGEGNDTVFSSVNYTLSADVENLILTGSANRNGTGNELVNTIVGNAGANRLDGGAGADVLVGGLGNDTYILDNVLDLVFEAPSAGTDTVESSVSYTLTANVERLTLTGDAAIDGAGNDLANTITGNDAANTLIGGLGNDKLIGGGGIDTLIGGIGNDVYVVDFIDDVLIELANEGTDTVQSSLDFTLAEHFENLTLTGAAITGTGNAAANRLTGNELANVLIGLEGNDTLDGKAGADTLIGGAGNDTYSVDDAADVTVELAGEGTDTVRAGVSYTIGAEIERLVLTGNAAIDGVGNELDNRLTGNAANNTLSGLAGNDILDGKAGADTLIGGAGNDTYYVDDAADTIGELADEGIDVVRSSVSFTLAAHVEDLVLTGADATDGTGNESANILTGNAAANTLVGLGGNDILDGKGGADTLIGGTGDDLYVADNVDDTVVEAADEGIDTIQTALSWTLGGHVENLTLTGGAAVDGVGNAADNVLTGNNAANVLTGLDGNDTLDGKGGADTMIGGAGDDSYYVDRAADVVIENPGEGNDTVYSKVSYTLGDNVENLTLIGPGNIAGTGNALDNLLSGNAGNNTLDGGLGADVMAGGLGNDTYIVDDSGDVVVEAAGGGVDTVKTELTYTLTAHVENLILTGAASVAATGNALDNVLTGNSASNVLTGLAGNDTLNGKGGADTMLGGAGDDTYVVDNTGDVVIELAGEGVDTVNSSVTHTLADHVENLILTGGGNRSGTGNVLDNILVGNRGANILEGLGGNDTLAGGLGNDTYRFDAHFGRDVIVEDDDTADNLDRIVFGAGIASTDIRLGRLNDDLVVHTVDEQDSIQVLNWFTSAANKIERIEFTGGVSWDVASIESAAMQVVDMPGLLRGDYSNTMLLGQIGNTILESGDGDDGLTDTDGNNVFISGAGSDVATGGDGNDLFIGGAGDDTLYTGAGSNLIAFNAGGGVDTVYADAGAENTLSLGGGLKYSDLSLSRDNNDLILNAGADDKVVLKDWYVGNSSLLNLQLILDATDEFDVNSADPLYNKRVQNFDFLGMVNSFDAAQAANPGLSNWALSDALMQYHLSGADDAALGGDLAYWYARNNALTGMSVASAQQIIGASGFGADAQTLHEFSGLQEGFARLN